MQPPSTTTVRPVPSIVTFCVSVKVPVVSVIVQFWLKSMVSPGAAAAIRPRNVFAPASPQSVTCCGAAATGAGG